MNKLFGTAILLSVCCQQANAQLSEDIIRNAERDIADRFASFGLAGMRGQLIAPGKSDDEKDQIIMAAVHKLANCYVSTSIEFAEDNGLSAESLLRMQAGWELTEADRDTMAQLDDNAFRAFQKPCKEAFLDALPFCLLC